jgi:CTP:molybdopterin cytidylyltransferase MocA
MDGGTTFLRADSDRHLWIIISDPAVDPNQVLIVNLTTVDDRKEKVCLLHPGDHPWIRHETCANYGDAVITTVTKLLAAKDGGAIVLQPPLAAAVLQRIRAAAMDSTRLALDKADILINQGLVPP